MNEDIEKTAPRRVQLRVSEIFHSIQGEASTVGQPTVFVRLTGCPLRCRYCDTEYAFSGGEQRTLESVLEQVASFATRHVCVTGGEPLAQAGCRVLLEALCEAGYDVSLETSGALDIRGIDRRVVIVMDIKTPSSGESARNRPANLGLLKPADQVKFVIGSRDDYEWAKTRLTTERLDERCVVLFSPAWGVLEPRALAEWILADRLSVCFQVQLHKYLWGEERGH